MAHQPRCLKMKIDSNYLASQQRGSFPGFPTRVTGAFYFCATVFPVSPAPPLARGFPSPARLTTADLQETVQTFQTETKEQLNYSNDPVPGLAFLCLGLAGLAAGRSGGCWLATPGCQSCACASSCGSQDQIPFAQSSRQTTLSFLLCSFFFDSSFSEEMDGVFVSDCHEME